MANYRLSRLADEDIENIYIYSARKFGQRQADAYAADMLRSAEVAAQFPLIGRRYVSKNGTEYRQYGCGRHILFYQSTESGIFIVRILHVNMDITRHLD